VWAKCESLVMLHGRWYTLLPLEVKRVRTPNKCSRIFSACSKELVLTKSDTLSTNQGNTFFVIHKKNPTRCNSVTNFIIQDLYEAQHVSGDTPLIIRSLKLHWQPLVFHTWKVVGRVVGGRCQAQYVPDNVHQLRVCISGVTRYVAEKGILPTQVV